VDTQAPLVPNSGISPAATDGEWVAIAFPSGVQVFRLDEKIRRTVAAQPAPWYPPAIDGELVAWVDTRAGTEDIWALVAGKPVAVATSQEQERHVAVSGSQVAWIDSTGVHAWDSLTGQTWHAVADAHTTRRLSFDAGVACWEDWNGVDVDVVCSDGVRWDGPGHQRAPDRQGEHLLVVDRGRALLLVLPQPSSQAP
jgi:hypothetical protein